MPGHQVVGRVVRIGKDVRGWKVGDRAGVAWLASTFGKCPFCVTGRDVIIVPLSPALQGSLRQPS